MRGTEDTIKTRYAKSVASARLKSNYEVPSARIDTTALRVSVAPRDSHGCVMIVEEQGHWWVKVWVNGVIVLNRFNNFTF